MDRPAATRAGGGGRERRRLAVGAVLPAGLGGAVPSGSLIRSTTGRHWACETGEQDSAHSQPPALAAATTGVGSGWAAQVTPSLRVPSSVPPVMLNTQLSGPKTAAICSSPARCAVAGSTFPLVTHWCPPSSVTARRTGCASMVTSVPMLPIERRHGISGAVSATP